MRRNTWTYTVQVTLVGKKEKTQERLARILDRKAVIEGAYDIARIGDSGGIYASYEAIAHYLREYHRKAYIRCVIDKHINPLDFSQKVALVRSLQKRFPAPGGTYVQKKPEELASNHYALIIDLARRLRNYAPTYYSVKGS